jgi:hypothetical protein
MNDNILKIYDEIKSIFRENKESRAISRLFYELYYECENLSSTRERVIQVWAHQRVLDGVYGNGRFVGLLTCLAETKLDHRTRDVIEICLPDQWRLYQLFISQLKRVYYLDVPQKYSELNTFFPKIHVKQFGEFFHEKELLLE